MKLSIKFRITLLCTLLAAVIAMLALNLLLAGEGRLQQDYYSNFLISAAEHAQDEVHYQNEKLKIDRRLDDIPGVRISLYNLYGDLIYGRRWMDLEFSRNEFRRVSTSSGNSWFTYDRLLEFDDGESIWLRCICSADAVQGIRSGSERLALIMIPALIILAGLGGYGIAVHAFRPVSRILRTAESIADGKDLKKRIGLDGVRDEIYALARSFDAMFARLENAFERECRFTSDVSHELRTPVASILAQSEFALSSAATDTDRTEALEQIHARAEGMSALIHRLLMLARMDAGHVPIIQETINLGELAELAALSFQEAASLRGITVITDDCSPVNVTGDQTMLMQAALNLIENAVRYNHDGGSVHVKTAVENAEAWLIVEDDGSGIPPESLPHLFERFYQVDASRRKEGSGLGLSITQRIALLHKGRVLAESAPGKGSRFALILPLDGESI